MGLDRCGMLASELSTEAFFVSMLGVLGGLEAFALVTWCMLDVPLLGLPLPELHRPQIGRSGLPWCSISYHTHCAHRQQSTKT
jgi:hypothetical protein